jgi:hypothetical protein
VTTPDRAGGADTLPAPGTRIRVTEIAYPDEEPQLYAGAVGAVREVGREYMTVDWDDPEVTDAALLLGADQWEVEAGG